MSANSRARALSGAAAGLTVIALFGATIVPASAAPVQPGPIQTPSASKLKLPDGTAASRVIPGRYLVETVATPLSRGGSKFSNDSTTRATTAAAKVAGAKVETSYSELWSGVSVTATDAQIKVLAQSPSVKAVYPVLRVALPKTTKSATTVSSALDQISALGLSQDGTGIKVGVIDTGIDYDNADLGGSGTNGTTTFPTARVTTGWDFVGDDYSSEKNNNPVPDANPDDCEGHGTHVSGIIGANGSGDGDSAKGVAPNVTFGAYRIFGCEGGTDTAIILAALNRAKFDKMNVVNLSLGSDFDSWPSYPDAVAVANLAKAGVVVAVAAGNSGDTGLFSAGSPAVGAGVISVASYEGATIKTKAIAVNGVKYAYTPVDGTAEAPVDNTIPLTLAAASPLDGCTAISPVTGNTALLIKRGTCDFRVKVQNAITAGAKAAVIYNNVPGLDSFTVISSDTPTALSIPAISIGGAQGEALRTTLPKPMTWMAVQSDLVNPDAGQISTFSSAGLAADLSLVPTISAPGAKIYSTLPVEQGGHGNLSGTSMATPYIAGVAAVMLQAKPALKGHPADLAKLLYNTATPVMKNTELGTAKPEAVFRQGSGLVNLAGAMSATVTASPSTIKLGEGTNHTVFVSLTNKTAGTLTYKVARISGVSAAASTSGGSYVGTTTPNYGWSDIGFKAGKSVTVKAGKTVKVKIKLTPPSVLKGKAGLLYGGWVRFTTTGAGNTVTVPFVGMRGDYQAVKVLNKFKYDDGVNAPSSMPGLGYLDGKSDLQFVTDNPHNYTNDPDAFDVPFAIYHLDYPASDVQLKITDQKTKKSYYAILDDSTLKNDGTFRISSKSTHLYKQSRDAGAQVIPLVGLYYKGKAYPVYNGTWKMQLRVLKPLGTSSKSKHWESWTSKVFTIG
ncbi:MAG TPA: S8 family serine peptidase [Propionicimonas sp.]